MRMLIRKELTRSQLLGSGLYSGRASARYYDGMLAIRTPLYIQRPLAIFTFMWLLL